MESNELTNLLNTTKVNKLSFDGYEFNIEFENGTIVTVGKTVEWDCAVWEFESNIEKEEKRIKWEKKKLIREEQNNIKNKKRLEILSKFPKEQWDEIRKTFRYI